MPLSPTDLRTIAAAASTIPERLAGAFLPVAEENSPERIQARLDAWCQAVAGGDWHYFKERLAWDGLDIAGARAAPGQVLLDEQVPLPEWTITVQAVLRHVELLADEGCTCGAGGWPFLDATAPCPFEEILAPFVVVAYQRYQDQVGPGFHLLSEGAHISLQRHLLQVLASLSVQALHAEFTGSRARAQSAATAGGSEQPVNEQQFYLRFIRHMYEGGLATFLRTYSVLARLLATVCDFWVEASVEILERLSDDWSAIQQQFGGVWGPVVAVQTALSNPHHGGRTTMALTFASGRKLVYRPRNLGMEESYYRFLTWCNEQGVSPPFNIPAVLNHSCYGWMEWVEHEPHLDRQAAQRYYRNTGILLCLAYVLGAANCSYEQIIVHGEQPALVGADMLLHAYPCPDHEGSGVQKQCADWEQQTYSVLHTGLLTGWRVHEPSAGKGYATDISGFGRSHKQGTSMGKARPQRQEQLIYGLLRQRARLNLPVCEDAPLSIEAYRAEVIEGFGYMYRFLQARRGLLLASDSPLYRFKGQRTRIVYRPEQAYRAVLSELLAPAHLRDGAERGIRLEQLGRDLIPVEYLRWRRGNDAHWWPACAAEERALAQGDLPFFTAYTDSTTLAVSSGQNIASCFHQPGFDLMLERFASLCQQDMHLQIACLERVLETRSAFCPAYPSLGELVQTGGSQRDTPTVPVREALAIHACFIAEELARQAIDAGDGGALWLLPTYLQRSRCYQLQPMRYSLFSGSCGVAFFLAAVAKISGESRYRKLALAALKPLHTALQVDSERVVREMGIGGAAGIGSTIYAFTKISQFLDEPALLEDAWAAAMTITAERVAGEAALDVIGGSAGAMLGLLAFYDASREQSIFERALICEQHLLQKRTASKAGYRAWPTPGGEHYTGFSHGAAGIAYALARLSMLTRDTYLLEAAREGLEFEERAFIPEAGTWADTLADGKPGSLTAWCHGATGIGLARLGGLPALDSAHIREEIEIALQTTRSVGLRGPDHLCCGNLGRAELFLTAAQRLERPDLADTARGHAWRVVERAQRRGMFSLQDGLPAWAPLPQFFHGLSGIGYTLLRLAHPSELPSVLLWE